MSLALSCRECKRPKVLSAADLLSVVDFDYQAERGRFPCECGGEMRAVRLIAPSDR